MNFDTIALYEVADVIDSLHKTPQYSEEGYPMIRVTDIKGGYLDFSQSLKVSKEVYEEFSKKYKPQIGDILVSRVGSYGNFSYVNAKNPFCLGQNTAIIVPKNVNSKFLYFWLTSIFVKEQIEQRVVGSTQKTLSLKNIKELKVPKISNEEQLSISKLLSSLEEKINVNSSTNKNLEEIAQALFKRWFVDFEFPNENGEPYKSSGGEFEESELGLIPNGWGVGLATEIFSVQSGGTPKTGKAEYWDGEIPFFTPKDSGSSFYTIDTEKKLTEVGLTNCNSKLYKIGTVFITARGTVGKLSIAGRDMAMNQSCYALVSRNGYTQKYVFLQTQLLINSIKKNASGAVFDAITVSTFHSLKVVLPIIELVEEFNKIIEGIFSSILKNINENQILSDLRDSLLPKLMSGEIRVPINEEYPNSQSFDMPLAAESKAQYSTT